MSQKPSSLPGQLVKNENFTIAMFGLNINWLDNLNNALFGHNLNCLIPEERICKQAAAVPSQVEQLCCFVYYWSNSCFFATSLTVFVLAGWTSCHPLGWTSSSLRAKLVAKNTLLCVMQKLSFESTYKMRPGQEFVGKKRCNKSFLCCSLNIVTMHSNWNGSAHNK